MTGTGEEANRGLKIFGVKISWGLNILEEFMLGFDNAMPDSNIFFVLKKISKFCKICRYLFLSFPSLTKLCRKN